MRVGTQLLIRVDESWDIIDESWDIVVDKGQDIVIYESWDIVI